MKDGGELCRLHHMHLPSLSPGQETTVSMEMKTPSTSGIYHCQWRVAMPGGALFGGRTRSCCIVGQGGVCEDTLWFDLE